MSEHEKQTTFLRHCLLYDDSVESHQLEERITQAHCDDRCVRRALWLVVLLGALAIAGLGYSAVIFDDFPQRMSQFGAHLFVRICSALGLASLICILAFLGLGLIFRRRLDHRREECRQLASRLMESGLGQPRLGAAAGLFVPPAAWQLPQQDGSSRSVR